MTKQTSTFTPMTLTGEALTHMIRSGLDVADLTTLDPEQIEAVRDGSAWIRGTTPNLEFVVAKGPINPAATRYALARQAYIDALEHHLGGVMAGVATDTPQTLLALWEEYRAARSALHGVSRVKEAG